jgi:hypothetical protein
MSTEPATPAGLVTEIDVAVTEPTVAGVEPNRTLKPLWKLVPLMVTPVPPVAGPLLGETPVMVGEETLAA